MTALLGGYFRVPVQIEQFVGHWMRLPVRDRTRLGAGDAGAVLGRGAVLGARVWDRQHKFRMQLGPLTLAQYENFLPGGDAIHELVAWIRHYLCHELEWDVRLLLASAQVPQLRLATLRSPRAGRRGWASAHVRRRRRPDSGRRAGAAAVRPVAGGRFCRRGPGARLIARR